MVTVIDSIMGSGKTSYMIQMINDNPDRRYMFITPYLSEVARIKQACAASDFQDPQNYGQGKTSNLKELLAAGCNIVSTHALFMRVDEETRALITQGGYTLILDEVVNVIEYIDVKSTDVELILAELCSLDETGRLIWKEQEYSGRFIDVKNSVILGEVYLVNQKSLVKVLPVRVFRCFKEAFVLTYMFECQLQKYYFDAFGVDYVRRGVTLAENGMYVLGESGASQGQDYTITIYQGRMNEIGENETALSKSWYQKAKNRGSMLKLKRNLRNYFRNVLRSPAELTLWTTFTDYQKELQGKGYTEGFIPCNARSSNEYRERINVAYTINRYVNPMISHFFHSRGIVIAQDQYALSELLQFLFRSGVREGKTINLYIPSKRMRRLLNEWFEAQKCLNVAM